MWRALVTCARNRQPLSLQAERANRMIRDVRGSTVLKYRGIMNDGIVCMPTSKLLLLLPLLLPLLMYTFQVVTLDTVVGQVHIVIAPLFVRRLL